MLKSKILGLLLGAALFASCEEQGPAINFDETASDPSDTTYIMSPVPAAQPRNVVLEEFTGVTCTNCPSAHDIVKSIKANYGDRFVPIGLYQENLVNFTGPVDKDGHKTKDDFRTPISDQINNTIYNAQGNNLPIGGVDRVQFQGEPMKPMDRAKWVAKIDQRMNVKSPVNLEAVSTWNDNGSLKVKVTITFTEEVTEKVYFTAGILQDNIIDAQLKGLQVIYDYEHEHVLRGLITPNGVNGQDLPQSGVYEKGRTFVRTININDLKSHLKQPSQYLNPDYIKPENCKVFVLVHMGNGNTEILQAIQVNML
jgi:hypothetical protein